MAINGNEYSWEDIQVKMPHKTVPLEGAIDIKYKMSREHKNVYGRGAKPVAMGRGRKTMEGSLKMLQSEFEALQAQIVPGKDATDLILPVISVSYAPEGAAATTDLLLHVRINEFEKGMAEGDPNMEIELPLTIGDIQYNV